MECTSLRNCSRQLREKHSSSSVTANLHAVAGGEDHTLHSARELAQRRQRLRQGAGIEREAFAHIDRCGLVIHACDQQLHRLNVDPFSAAVRKDRNPTCAAQVSAEQPSAATVSSAVLRPRHPAFVRSTTMKRKNPQVANATPIFGCVNPARTQFDECPDAGRDHPECNEQKAGAHGTGNQIVQRAQAGGSRSNNPTAGRLLFSRRSWIR